MNSRAFTGRGRKKTTPWRVRAGDVVARAVITVGGIGTVVAVLLVFVSLLVEVWPLFRTAKFDVPRGISSLAIDDPGGRSTSGEPASSDAESRIDEAVRTNGSVPLIVTADEFGTVGWALTDDGVVTAFRLDNGKQVERRNLLEGSSQPVDGAILAAVLGTDGRTIAVALGDGTLRTWRIEFDVEYFSRADVPEAIRSLAPLDATEWDGGLVQRTAQDQIRLQRLRIEPGAPVTVSSEPVERLDFIPPAADAGAIGPPETKFACWTRDDKLKVGVVTERVNDFSGETEVEASFYDVPLDDDAPKGSPLRVLLTAGDNLIAVWPDGTLYRFDVRTPSSADQSERLDVVPDERARLTACEVMVGRETIVCADSQGGLAAWFRVRHQRDLDGDPFTLTRVHELIAPSEAPSASSSTKSSGDSVAVVSLAPSPRSRLLAAALSDQSIRVFHVTTDREVARVDTAKWMAAHAGQETKSSRGGEMTASVASPGTSESTGGRIAWRPQDNGLFVFAGRRAWYADFAAAHPEASFGSLFLPVWYEGHEHPKSIWQSSYATEAAEVKLGMAPLVFGTIKATAYTMLFATPLALLAAIYTSEFLRPGIRARVKPAIEAMASLPSVVLGFLAANVFAPLIERVVPSTLAAFVFVPACILAASYAWQLLPRAWVQKLQPHRLWFIFLPLFVGLALAYWSGPIVERWFFAGDVRRWLDGQIGDAIGGWMLAWTPVCCAAAALFVFAVVNPMLRAKAADWNRTAFGAINLTKFAAGLVVALAAAYCLSRAMSWIGWDLRGTLVDTYQQRNALIVGFVMGFAVIPLIYTIADDALATVPNHLRSASLGCGATTWQTTVRVVLPTAASGLFSALMIGLGRAVGETMIVLMAAGNTPVMEWNPFNGFRTLSANIAVEMPEAVRGDTHYRTLFLAALTLFLMTFVVNTAAEMVRLRFRRRAYQL